MTEFQTHLVFVCGPIASGKSTEAKKLITSKGAHFVEVSDLVKNLLQETQRSKLQNHPELDKIIIEQLKKIAQQYNNCLVISGVRQLSILRAFQNQKPLYVWIEVPEQERLSRFLNRKDSKDILTKEAFYQAQEKDNELGLHEVYLFCCSHGEIIKQS